MLMYIHSYNGYLDYCSTDRYLGIIFCHNFAFPIQNIIYILDPTQNVIMYIIINHLYIIYRTHFGQKRIIYIYI